MNIWISVIVLVIAAAIFIVVEAWLSKRLVKKGYEYKKRGCIMTQSEVLCFNALVAAVGDRYYIFPQIHLPSLLDHKVVGQSWYGAFRHIDEKSVDFVLCDKINLSPILAIELDDKSHERPERQERDREVERILKAVGTPLLRIKSHTEVDLNILSQKIGISNTSGK